ncbi:MAG: hypothetical protein ACO3S5_12070, partial [Ilumatobacteraceae bacterium]
TDAAMSDGEERAAVAETQVRSSKDEVERLKEASAAAPAHGSELPALADAALQGRLDDRRQSIVAVVSAVGIVVLVVAYLFGRRSGRRKTTFVEIRRS